MSNGTWLALGALGVLGLAGAARGSRAVIHPLSRVQQSLLRVKNTYSNPETVVRVVDVVVSALPEFPSTEGLDAGLPAVYGTRGDLLRDIESFRGAPSTMEDYRDLIITFVRNNSYGEALNASIDLNVDWGFAPHIPWIAREVHRLVKAQNKGRISEDALASGVEDIHNKLPYVLDWVSGERPNLMAFDFNAAHEASTEWHNRAAERVTRVKQQRLRREGKWFDCPGGIASQQGQVVHQFSNGWTIQRLTSMKQLREEGNISSGGGCLKHCVGDSEYYMNQADAGTHYIDSLRSPDNKPFVTLTIRASDGSVVQAKGLQNRLAGAVRVGSGQEVTLMRRLGKQYKDIDSYLDDEARMLNEYLKSHSWSFESDGSQVKERLLAMRQRKVKGSQNRAPRQAPKRRLSGWW